MIFVYETVQSMSIEKVGFLTGLSELTNRENFVLIKIRVHDLP